MKVKTKYPPMVMPTCLVGANVDGKPNFMAIAWLTFLESQPVLVGFASDKTHHTGKGIRQNGTFSVNVPSTGLVVETDYCGLHSGSRVDKSRVFDVYYGELGTAPMISACPVDMECKHVRTVEFVRNEFIVGEVVATYVEDSCLTEGRPDLKKIDPLIYVDGPPPDYRRLGKKVAQAFSVGKGFVSKKTGARV